MLLKYLSFIILLFSFNTVANETINVGSDVWCPYICNEVHKPGVLIEVLNEVANHNGLEIKFNIIPLARSLILLQQSKLDMVLALTGEHIEEYDLKRSLEAYGGWYNDFYIIKTNPWKFSSIEGLKKHIEQGNTLGIIKGYKYGDGIAQLQETSGQHIFSATGNNPLTNILMMLSHKRISMVLDSRFNIEYELQNSNISNLKYAGTDGDFVPLYIGYAPKSKVKYINVFDQGLIRLRATGQLSKILKRYGIPDWQKSPN
jgi:polar amino acid transport system substrate-binding protein